MGKAYDSETLVVARHRGRVRAGRQFLTSTLRRPLSNARKSSREGSPVPRNLRFRAHAVGHPAPRLRPVLPEHRRRAGSPNRVLLLARADGGTSTARARPTGDAAARRFCLYKLFINPLRHPYARGRNILLLTIRLPKPPAAPENGVEKGGAGEPTSRRARGRGASQQTRPKGRPRVGHFQVRARQLTS